MRFAFDRGGHVRNQELLCVIAKAAPAELRDLVPLAENTEPRAIEERGFLNRFGRPEKNAPPVYAFRSPRLPLAGQVSSKEPRNGLCRSCQSLASYADRARESATLSSKPLILAEIGKACIGSKLRKGITVFLCSF